MSTTFTKRTAQRAAATDQTPSNSGTAIACKQLNTTELQSQ